MFKTIIALMIIMPIAATIVGVNYYSSNTPTVYPVSECSIDGFSLKELSTLESNPIEECKQQSNMVKSNV